MASPTAACAKRQHFCTQLRSIQPLPAAAVGVMGTSESFFRPPGDRLQQVCLFIDLRNSAEIKIKPLRKGAQAAHLAQGRAFVALLTAVLASLEPCPYHHQGHGAVRVLILSLSCISHNFLPADTPSAEVSRLCDEGDRETILAIATAR